MGKKLTISFVCALLGLLLLANQVTAQNTVTGVVKNTDGQPLKGVSVFLKGTSSGTITDGSGAFSFQVKDLSAATISFTSVGYISQDIKLSDNISLNITLVEDPQQLQQVVVVGYGTQKKANLTGSVSVLDTKDLINRPISQTSQALQGKLSGVTVTQNFGVPGSDAGTIRIRGIGTLGNSNPLILIDGVQGNLNDINPNDIENLSVLKDASSASIYGSRAANGVILVTTKRGKKNESMSVTYTGTYSSQLPTDLPEIVDGVTFLTLRNESERNNGRPNLYSDAYINNYKQNIGTEPNFNTDWFGLAMKNTAPQFLHNLSIRGGGEKISAMVSLSLQDQDALINRSGFIRKSIRFNTNFQATNKLSFALDGFINREETNRPNVPGGLNELFRMMTELPNIYPGIWADGTLGEGWNGANPYALIEKGGTFKSQFSRMQFNLRGVYNITSWLKVEGSYSPKYLTNNSQTTIKNYRFKRIDGSTGNYPTGLNALTNSNDRSTEEFYQGLIKVNKKIKQHLISGLAGYEMLTSKDDNFSATRQNFLLPSYEVLSSGDGNFQTNGGNASEWALISYFGRINYVLNDKYLFEANLRRDGSSRFASDKRWGLFPSFSAGWRISEENFLKNSKVISSLKLRASWGQLGNQEIGNYPYLGVVSINQPYYFGGTVAPGAAQIILPNSNVTWETTTLLNGGFDFQLFGSKLTGSLDIYKKNTVDILYKRDIPAVIGLAASEQNIAEVRNTGWDFQIGWQDNLKKFRYGADIVLSDVRNKVINLNGKPQYGLNVIFENEEYQAFYGYEAIGIYRTAADLTTYPTLNTAVKLGDLIFKDQNKDGIIDPTNDKKIIGSNIPRLNYGLTFNLGYEGFDFSLFLQGVGKKDMYYTTRQAAYGGTYYTYQLTRYVPDDPSTHQTSTFPRISPGTSNDQDNSFFIYNASYLRVKNIYLGYTIPKNVMKRLNTNSARVFISGTNLFTFDKLPINTIDPEGPNTGSGANYYPNIRTLSLGIEIKF